MTNLSGSDSVALEPEPGSASAGREAFERERIDAGALFERYADDIYRYCRARGCARADAEDITGEVFAQALPRLKTLRWRRRPVVAFLYTVASRRVADHFRQRAREGVPASSEGLPAQSADHAPALRDALARALHRLPEREQLAVVLRIIHGYSFAEVARAVGGSEKAVKSLVYRGLERMQAALMEEGIEP